MTITGEFEELQKDLEKIKKDVDTSISRVTDFQSDWLDLLDLDSKISKLLSKTNEIQTKLLDFKTVNKTVDIFYKRALDEARITLKQFVIDAANSSQEFGRPLLKDPLVKCCDAGGIITLKLNRNGWFSTIKATANLDEIMGTLEQWGMAVSAVRTENDWGMTEPTQSSAIWRDSIFLGHANRNRKTSGGNTNKTSNWSTTIMDRLANAGSPAPYWKLLNNGQMTSLSSDRGGIPFPKEAPTFFKENAEEQIEKDFKSDMLSAKNSWDQFVIKVRDFYSKVKLLQSRVTSALQSMERETTEPAYEELPIKKVISGYGLDEGKINYNKLLTAIDELIIYGETITIRTTKAGRIEITMKGGPRKRISVRKLRAFLGG